jgi:8-oxo-dGTP pyrophosphatase MutT (NUDIX family)
VVSERSVEVAAQFATDLSRWKTADDAQAALKDEYRAFIGRNPAASVERDLSRQHLTASAFVFSPDLEQVLLCFHRKGNFWVQLGGHIESSDRSVHAASLREAREEGGIEDLEPVTLEPLDLDRHDLGAGFVHCHTHWDVGFGFTTSASSEPRVSDESTAVRWWPVVAPPDEIPPGFVTRLRRAAQTASHIISAGPGRA